MSFTPVEIRHVRFGRALLGYRRGAVDHSLAGIAASFEGVWQERIDLVERVDQLEQEVAHHREVEELLRTTLVSAERVSKDVREEAKREAQAILDQAHSEARAITSEARRERERLLAEARRVRTLLTAALDAVGDAEDAEHRVADAAQARGAEAA